jgi:hypothetical protein
LVKEAVMKKHYPYMVQAAESAAQSLMKRQINSPGDFNHGGFFAVNDGTVPPANSCGALMQYTQTYLCPESKYHHDKEILNRMEMALSHMERVQRPDGTWDLLTTNFYSSPDTGFIMHNLAKAYRLMKLLGGEEITPLSKRLYQVIEKAGEGMASGGFHTPNHRWVISAGLLLCHSITGRKAFKESAEQYLAEGIDCDEYGEFTEKSSGVYNTVNDNALIIISEETGDDAYLDHVKRNLDMMRCYIDPDGSVFTQNSTRQDKGIGAKKYYPTRYYHLYLLMAYKRNIPEYAWMADTIFEDCIKRGSIPNNLALFMLNPELAEYEPELIPVSEDYSAFFQNSGIYRSRKGNMGLTLLKNNSEFLFFQVNELLCSMKISASFFAVAQFRGEELEKDGNGFIMKFCTSGGYRLPLDPPPDSPFWEDMDHSKREIAKKLDLEIYVRITPMDEGADVHVSTKGCDRVPIKAELSFSPGGVVQGESFAAEAAAGSHLTVKSGMVKVLQGNSGISVGPAFASHYYDDDMRGTEPPLPGRFTLYFTDFTNTDRTISIRAVKGDLQW